MLIRATVISELVIYVLLSLLSLLPSITSQETCRSILPRSDSLPIVEGSYAIQWCHDETSCKGHLRIHRRYCDESLTVSLDNSTNDYFKKTYGPDSYYIVLEGIERVVASTDYQGECKYTAQYEIASKGAFTLKIQLLYHHYEAVSEVGDATAIKIASKPGAVLAVRKNFRGGAIAIGRRLVHTRKYRPSVKYLNVAVIEPIDQVMCLNPTLEAKALSHPVCQNGRSSGRWIRIESPAGNSTDIWRPYNCSYPALEWWGRKETIRCLRGKKLFAIGDSQVRYVYHWLLTRIATFKILNNRRSLVSKIFSFDDAEGHLDMQYEIDPFLSSRTYYNMVEGRIAYDIFVAGMGSWPASGAIGVKLGLWSDVRYRRHMELKIHELAEFMRRNRSIVIWYSMPSPAHPPKDPRLSRERFMHMAHFASNLALKAGIPVVDSFVVSEAMAHTSFDKCHYNNHVTVANSGVLQNEICRLLGIFDRFPWAVRRRT